MLNSSTFPNHPRYQLRYTRIFTFRFLEISLSVVKAVVKCNFGVHFNGQSNPANARVSMASDVSDLPRSDTGTALPKLAPYQLGYTRIFDFLIIISRGKPFAKNFASETALLPLRAPPSRGGWDAQRADTPKDYNIPPQKLQPFID